ncbi:MAG: EamA family transporter [Fibrobacterota bacterium]|nr:EamA family transporter [Chitinispirillaceae bacterium]
MIQINMWLLLSCCSAVFLGIYDVSKKHAVNRNAVIPVLFLTTTTGVVCTLPLIVLSWINRELAQSWHIYVPPQTLSMHLLIFCKSLIVGTSWMLSYFGLKHLPISIATPLRATAPLFTVLGAVTLFGERPTSVQWAGIVLILTSYLIYSKTSKGDTKKKAPLIWIVFMILAAVTGAISAGFDKYLLQSRSLPPLFVLCWFLFYLSIIYGVVTLVLWCPQRKKSTPLTFRYSIVMVGVLLVIADIFYMTALSDPDAKLAVVSSIRRTNILISFIGGFLVFHEGNVRKRLVPFCGIIAGLICLMV